MCTERICGRILLTKIAFPKFLGTIEKIISDQCRVDQRSVIISCLQSIYWWIYMFSYKLDAISLFLENVCLSVWSLSMCYANFVAALTQEWMTGFHQISCLVWLWRKLLLVRIRWISANGWCFYVVFFAISLKAISRHLGIYGLKFNI